MPKHGVQNQTRTKPELWFAAKSQYFLYDESSHLEAKLTCTTAIGRQAVVEEILLFVGKRKGGNRPVQGVKAELCSLVSIQKRINEKSWQQNDQKMPFETIYYTQWCAGTYLIFC
jgi:hypothetical protein